MARGWESKAVEAQIEESKSTSSKQHFSPVSQQEAHRKSHVANLQLSRQRILQQLESSTNERYTEMLNRSLAELEGQLKTEL